jgi:hypothetical protein
MIGRRLIDTLARMPPPGPLLDRRPFQPGPQVPPWPQRGLRRPCGCVTDVTVFGHTGCPDAPPDPLEVR